MPLATTMLGSAAAASWNGAGTIWPVQTNDGSIYVIYVDNATADVVYQKSTDGGLTFGAAVTIFTGTATAVAVWYDRWSGIAGDLIHVAYIDSGDDDTDYRSIDNANSDTLSTQTVIFAGLTTSAGGALSICRARGGNLYCATMIDAGAEGGFFRSTDVGATWGSRATVFEAITSDQIILVPGWAADDQDMMAFFWDASASEISRKLYDDSADSWAETSIATTMTLLAIGTGFSNFDAAVDITNSRNLLVAWSATDTLNADLRCWHVTESAITEVTNVVLNSTDDQGLCGIGIDTDTQDWHVWYAGKSNGSNTWNTTLNLCCKISTDDGSTWGSEQVLTPRVANPGRIAVCPRFATERAVAFICQTANSDVAFMYDAPTSGGADSDRAATIVNGALVQ